MGQLLQCTEQMRLERWQSKHQNINQLGVNTWHTNSLVTGCSLITMATDNLGENQSLTPKVRQNNCDCQTLLTEKGSNWVCHRLTGWLLQCTEQMQLEWWQSKQRRKIDQLGVNTQHTTSLVIGCSPTTTATDNLGESKCLTPKVRQSDCNCQTLPTEKGSNWVCCRLTGRLLQHTEQMQLEQWQSKHVKRLIDLA